VKPVKGNVQEVVPKDIETPSVSKSKSVHKNGDVSSNQTSKKTSVASTNKKGDNTPSQHKSKEVSVNRQDQSQSVRKGPDVQK
jgi:hypothetical protein